MLSSMLESDEPERVRRLSRVEYEQMVDIGMFYKEPVELLHGVLVAMSPQNDPHQLCVALLVEQLVLQIDRARHMVRPQLPISAGDWSKPEPDVTVVARNLKGRMTPGEALLVIEVAYSSLRRDRGIKLAIYAEAGFPEYWIVDLKTRTVAVHTEPGGETYQRVVTLREGDVLRPALLPTVAIAVADILAEV
jgi:Uma2 family endonuclease